MADFRLNEGEIAQPKALGEWPPMPTYVIPLWWCYANKNNKRSRELPCPLWWKMMKDNDHVDSKRKTHFSFPYFNLYVGMYMYVCICCLKNDLSPPTWTANAFVAAFHYWSVFNFLYTHTVPTNICTVGARYKTTSSTRPHFQRSRQKLCCAHSL